MPCYHETYPVGSKVQIISPENLDVFRVIWKYHHKLTPAQLKHADQLTEVVAVSFYHGGDVLYELKDAPGIWHEECLKWPAPTSP